MGYSAEDFYEVVNVYNQSMGPIPFVVYAAALFAAMVAAVRSRLMSVAACCVLAAMWLINGLVFHLNFYAIRRIIVRLSCQKMVFAIADSFGLRINIDLYCLV